MNNHRHHAQVLEKKRTKRALRKEVRDICKTIVSDPDIIETDEYIVSHLSWEHKS